MMDEIKKLMARSEDCKKIMEQLEKFNADAQQVKEAIKKSVGNAIESIRLREQHLLRQVDYTSEHISSLLHTEALIQAEVSGKLKSCIEISNVLAVENDNSIDAYVKECLRAAQQLCKRQENLYERGSLSFISNEDQLAKNIQQFGRVINTSLHLHSDGSERSWEFAGSEVMSYASETFDGNKRTESPCHDVCTGPNFEIEDMDKHFGITTDKPFLTLDQFCRAKRACQSIKDCLFDEPCRKVSPRNIKEPDMYVAKILDDLYEIGDPEAAQQYLPDTLEHQSDFQRTTALLNDQFRSIIEQNPCSAAQCSRSDFLSDDTSSSSVDSLAYQMDLIVNGPSVAEKTGQKVFCNSLSMLASEINAIISSGSARSDTAFVTLDLAEEVKKLNLDMQPNESKLSNPKLAAAFENVSKPNKLGTTADFEKYSNQKVIQHDAEDGDFAYLENITGSTTLKDLNGAILGIIDS